MGYIQPKTDFKDGDILYGIDLNASNEVIKAGVDDNFDRIQGLEDSKQDTIDNDNKLDYSLISNTPDIPDKTSDLTNDSGFIDNTYHDSTKQDVLTAGEGIQIENNVISNTQTSAEWGNIQGAIGDQVDLIGLLEDKQDKLISGTNIKTINNQSILGSGNISVGGGSGGTSDYDELDNRPQINSVTLTGNKSLSDLGINNPTKVSDLTNDAGYITSSYHDNTKQDKIDANNKLPYSYVSGTPTIPTKISDLTNDNNTVTDVSYVHTDNNYTSAEKTKLAGIEAGAQVNVDEVLVGDVNSATEDTKLVIEETDLDFQSIDYDTIFPIGKVEIFFDSLDHSNYLGLTWEQVGAGRVPVGLDTNDTDFNTIGKTGGSKELQAHRHKTGIQASYYGNGPAGSDTCKVLLDTSNGITTSETGTGNSGNLQPYIVMAFWKRVS